MNDDSRKNRMVALIGTIAFHVIVIVIMLLATMRYSASEPRRWPPVDSSEILFGGEYVMLSNDYNDVSTPSSEMSEGKPEGGADLKSEGRVGDADRLVASDEPSPMSVEKKNKPEERGPTKEEIAERERIKQEQEVTARIRNQVKFGSQVNAGGRSGSSEGNSETGVADGSPGHTLKGRTLESFGRPRSRLTGVVRIRVRVNPKGQVVGNPEYVGGEGPASANMSIRNSCISASRESRFSVSVDATSEQVGVITWRFE